jgi:hypothetical protein
LQPNEKPREHASEHDTMISPPTGKLLIDVEGHAMSVKREGSVYVPHRVAIALEASGDKSVIRFTATKSE